MQTKSQITFFDNMTFGAGFHKLKRINLKMPEYFPNHNSECTRHQGWAFDWSKIIVCSNIGHAIKSLIRSTSMKLVQIAEESYLDPCDK